MKNLWMLVAALVFCGHVFAIVVPYSDVPVLTEDNMITDFSRIDPEDGKPETLKTKAWLWQDGNDLVVYFEAEIDETFEVHAAKMRDMGGGSDYLRVQLVTAPQSYFAYYLLAFPQGGLYDGTRNTDLSVDYGWNCNYSYESSFGGGMWRLTMRIPLHELRFPAKAPYDWKIILGRYNKRGEEIYSSPFVVSSMGKDYFLNGHDIRLEHPIKRDMDVKIKPYLVKSYDLTDKSASFDPDNLGLDISLNPSQRTRIKLSFNPDYSDVPPDGASDDYNSKYPPYYNENRFFFSEDIDAFGFSDTALYTRNIAKPSFAFKATGSTQYLKWGVLGARDKEITEGGYLINPDDYFQVLSLRPVFKQFDLNTGIVSRINKGYFNHVLQGTAGWEFIPDWQVIGAFLGSTKKDEAEAPHSRQGHASQLVLNYSPEEFNATIGYGIITKDFESDAGYYTDKDTHGGSASLGWNPKAKDRFLRSFSVGGWGSYYQHGLDAQNPATEYSLGFNANALFKPKFNCSVIGNYNQALDLYDNPHQTYNGLLQAGYNASNLIALHGAVNAGKTIVYQLSETYPYMALNVSAWGTISKKLLYSISSQYRQFGYDRYNQITMGGNEYTIFLDDRYVILNSTLTYHASKKAQVAIGGSLDSYERSTSKGWARVYGSVRYEIMPESFIYMGFSTQQTKTEDFQYDTAFDHFRKDSSTAYVKLAITL